MFLLESSIDDDPLANDHPDTEPAIASSPKTASRCLKASLDLELMS